MCLFLIDVSIANVQNSPGIPESLSQMSPFSFTLVLREKNLRANVAFLAKTGEQRKTDSRQLVRGGGEGEGGDGGRGGRRQRVNESTDSR